MSELAGIEIRRLTTASEVSAILPLRSRVLYEPVGLAGVTELSAADLAEKAIHVAAFAGEVAVGTVRIDLNGDSTSLVRHMGVDPKCRRRGIAAELLAAAETFARQEHGSTTSVLFARPGSELFYIEQGYVYDPSGESMICHGDPNPKMIKELYLDGQA